MKRIFEDILDDIDINDKSENNVIGKLDSSVDSVDVSRYDFVMHLGFYLGASYNEIDKNVILKNAKSIKERYCDYFNKVEKYLNVFVDEYWTDGLWYTNGGILLDDLTEYKLKEISLIRFFYANKVYYIKFDNNYHHFFKFLQLYSNYFNSTFTVNVSSSCVPYNKIKDFEDINSLMRGTYVENSYMRHKNFFIKSLEFNSGEVNMDLNELRLSSKEQLRQDAENIYHYFYLNYKILKILDKFKTEEEKIVFIEDYIWKLKLKGLKNK